MSEQLKPCPFCGAAAELVPVRRDRWAIEVQHDESCVFDEDHRPTVPKTEVQKQVLINDWNRRASLAGAAEPVEMSPEFTDSARAALLWVLWHHQGGSSPVGQPIRFALGMGAHDRLNEHQIAQARVWQDLHPVNPSVYPRGQVPAPIPEPVATLHDDGYYTFKRGQEPQGARYAGWRMDVFAAPQPSPEQAAPRQALTAERVREIVREAGYDLCGSDPERAAFINGLRHGERAHGITTPTEAK